MKVNNVYTHADDNLYAVLKIVDYIKEDEEGDSEIESEDATMFLTIDETYDDAVYERFTFEMIEQQVMWYDSIVTLIEQGYSVIFIGLAGHDRYNQVIKGD